MVIEIRAIEPGEIDAMMLADERGFGGPAKPEGHTRTWTEAELDRTRCAFDGDEIVGVSRTYSFELTVPGGATVPAAAVSWVSVAPTHRRRGILTQMINALHDDARARDEPVAILTASESVIYGRFGYGTAAWRLGLKAERAHIDFRSDVRGDGRMRMLTNDEAQKVLPELYDRMMTRRAGMVSRPDFWWPQVFWAQFAHAPKFDKAFFTAVHANTEGVDDGYVAYELTGDWAGGIPARRLIIWDMQAADARAHAALWQFIFGVDLIGTVSATNAPIDDPLRFIVNDPRRVRVDYVNDGLWLAPLEPAPLLAARRYATAGRVVFEVNEPGGGSRRFALEGGPDGATCVPSTAPADIVCPTTTLGACALGGNRWSELAAAGLATGEARVLEQADAMFLATPAPALLSYF
jgi:predicted acetyltransferase